MDRPSRYWKAVLISTVVLCAVAALAWFVVPGVRSGAVPPIGGIVWHALGALQLLLVGLYAPVVARVGQATNPTVGLAALLTLAGVSALLVSLIVCLPFRLSRRS